MLQIGITGHRIIAETEKIEQSIHFVFLQISKFFPNRTWRLVSSLAEGADCLVIKHVMSMRGEYVQIEAILPFAEERYLSTFTSNTYKRTAEFFLKTAKKIVMHPSLDDQTAYHAAGKYIVEHSDIIVAIWDGQPAQGRGGAGDVVKLAREQDKPLAWILAGNRIPGTLTATTLGSQQGHIIFERFSSI